MSAPRTAEHSDSETVTAVVSAAARAAAALVPATTELVPGAPVSDPDTVPLPPGAASAITAGLSRGGSGGGVPVLSGRRGGAPSHSPPRRRGVAAAPPPP